MAAKRSRLNSALVPLGLVALVAGCGGGSLVSKAGGGTTYVPPGPASGATPGPMVSAQLLIRIPARSGSSTRKKPAYYSSKTQTVTLAYAASPNPLPSPSVFSVPTPGATPTSFPIPIQVPAGTETFQVNMYDGTTCCGPGPIIPPATAGGYLLSTATVNQTINPNGQQTITIVGQGVPSSVYWSSSADFVPLQNAAVDQPQTLTLIVQDAGGNPITGTLAAPINIAPTNGPSAVVSVSPAVISTIPSPGIPVTITYKAGSRAGVQIVPTYAGPSAGITPFLQTKIINPTFYVWVTNANNNTVSILDGKTGANIPGSPVDVSVPIPTPAAQMNQIAVQSSGCTGGEAAVAAVIGSGGTAYEAFITVPPVGPSPAASPTVIAAGSVGGASATAVTFDSNCVSYVGSSGFYMGTAAAVYQVAVNGSIGGTDIMGGLLNATAQVNSVVANGGYVYAAQSNGGGNNVIGTNLIAPFNTNVAAEATALAPHGSIGFAAAFPGPSPGPKVAFVSYSGSTVDSSTFTNPVNDNVQNMVFDAIGGYYYGADPTGGGGGIWKGNLSTGFGLVSLANVLSVSLGPPGTDEIFVVANNHVEIYRLSTLAAPSTAQLLNIYAVGTTPKGIAVGP